uniref:ATP synthase complex subunit 8 n=1 Tax=Tectus pyramis TaxID=500102 RepID=A0A291C523_9VEST|nr:ATP synthase F0 subunit 8 [Tectus pyramis]ATF29384.1 ATP synthase F0 subunit 8 [Tectus pyramis]
MPQLAPVNWIFLFILFWFVIGIVSVLIWWSFKVEYKIQGMGETGDVTPSINSSWSSANMDLKSWKW